MRAKVRDRERRSQAEGRGVKERVRACAGGTVRKDKNDGGRKEGRKNVLHKHDDCSAASDQRSASERWFWCLFGFPDPQNRSSPLRSSRSGLFAASCCLNLA